MSRVSKKGKKKSNNTNQITKLSDIAPELAVYDILKKQFSYALLFRKAKCIARHSAEENFSTSRKSTIQRLFSEEHFFAVRSSRTYLLTVENLSQEDRNNLCREFKKCFDKIKDLLFESLDNKVQNLDKFNELEREEITLMQEVDFDAGTFLTQGIVDETTREVTYPKSAKTRQETSGNDAGEDGPPEGVWSKPMPKSRMMSALSIDSYETFNSFADTHGIKKINHKTHQIRLDKMDTRTREKLEKA